MLRNMKNTAGGRAILGTQYVGLLAAQILADTATGPNGAGAMYNDGLVTGKRYRMLLASPGTFPGTVYEDGSFTASASFSTTYRLYEDNILVPYSGGGFDVPFSFVLGTVTTRSVTLRLVDRAEGGAPVPSLSGLRWAFFDSPDPSAWTAGPVDRGSSESTDANGDLVVSLPSTTLNAGDVGWLVVTNSDGTVTQAPACRSFSAPVVVA